MYSLAINETPKEASLYANRAAAYSMMNLHDKVIADCHKCIALDQKYTKAYSRLLKAYTLFGNFDKGLEFVVKAKENNIYDPESRDNNIKQLSNEIKEFYKNKDSFDLALTNYRNKDYNLAVNYLNSLKDLCSKSAQIWLLLIECMIDDKKSYEAKEKIKIAYEMFPRLSSDLTFIYFDALSDYFTGDLKTCQEKLKRLALMDSSYKDLKYANDYIENAEDLKKKGNDAFKNKKAKEALEFYSQALALDERNIEYNSKIYSNRSACHEQLGEYMDAYDDICEAIDLNPNWAKAYLRRGNIYYHLELYTQSLEDYNKAKQLDQWVSNDIDNKIGWCNNKIKNTKKKDLYEVLDISKEATDAEIKKAWKKKSLLLHPDRMVGKRRAEKIKADKELRDINEANDILSDKTKRSQYDQNGFDEHGNLNEGFSGGMGGGMGGMDIGDLLGMFGGGSFGGMGGPGVKVRMGGTGGSRRSRGGGAGFGGGSEFYEF